MPPATTTRKACLNRSRSTRRCSRTSSTQSSPKSSLQHVHAVHGSKYYGTQLGPVPVPLTEESPRANNRNFYFVQEDFLREQSRGKQWSYSTSRPHSFCDPAIDYARSASMVIAVYAAYSTSLVSRFDFPGTAASFEVPNQFTDTALLARAIVWMATEPGCANQSFNVVNGDYPSWSELWPRIAKEFDMRPGKPANVKLATYMADKGPLWDSIVHKHKLHPTRLNDVALWPVRRLSIAPRVGNTFVDGQGTRSGFQRDARHWNNVCAAFCALPRREDYSLDGSYSFFGRRPCPASGSPVRARTYGRSQLVRHEPARQEAPPPQGLRSLRGTETLLRSLLGFELVRSFRTLAGRPGRPCVECWR